MNLNNLNIGEIGFIKKVNCNKEMLIRLYNLGLIEGTKIKVILKNKGIKAYYFRNNLVAIRNSDASMIEVGKCNA